MAKNKTEGESSVPTPQRRLGRNRKTTPLVASIKEYVDSTTRSEMEALSNELTIALGSISNGNQSTPESITTGPTTNANGAAALGGLRRTSGAASQQQKQKATSAGRMILGIPSVQEQEASTTTPSLRAASSTGQLSRRRSSAARSGRNTSSTASCVAKIPSWDGYYKPKASSRRNSQAGSELVTSMKLSAQNVLLELGEISDDENDEDWLGLSLVEEESVRGGVQENSSGLRSATLIS